MKRPTEPTIVFAGVQSNNVKQIFDCECEAFMVSYAHLSKKLPGIIMERPKQDAVTYLDSGVFTFMRRAGVSYQNKSQKSAGTATWEEFRKFAKGFISYIRRDMDVWDWIVELDVDELFSVEIADMFRKQLKDVVGDKLLPVWHAQRGPEGWSQMVREFPYVSLSPTKTFNRGKGVDRLIESMLDEAHDNDCRVHILGVENIKWFQLGADSFDASSWSSGARWGQWKLPGAVSNIVMPTRAGKSRRPVTHSHVAQFKAHIAKWGFTLEDLKVEGKAKEVGIRLLQERQEIARARRLVKAVG